LSVPFDLYLDPNGKSSQAGGQAHHQLQFLHQCEVIDGSMVG
jgi:hypothetical protein